MSYCVPVDCCCAPWNIPRGETAPLRIDWGPWLDNSPGFVGINEIVACYLLDLNANQPFPPADPYEIALVSGYEPPPAQGNPGWAQIITPRIVEVLIEAADDTRLIGRVYRLDMKVKANDCNGRRIAASDCVFITVTQC